MSSKTAEKINVRYAYNLSIKFAAERIGWSQSLSTQEGQFGTRAQAEVHDENLVRVCHGDAKALQGVFQQLINWMVELNFGKDAACPKGEFDLQSYATFSEIIQAIQNKIPVSKEALYTRYKLPRPKNAEDEFIHDGVPAQMLSDGVKKTSENPCAPFSRGKDQKRGT